MVRIALMVWDRLCVWVIRVVCGRMSSRAARELAARRWGSQRPIKLAKELALRAAELPEVERRQLLDALSEVRVTRRPS